MRASSADGHLWFLQVWTPLKSQGNGESWGAERNPWEDQKLLGRKPDLVKEFIKRESEAVFPTARLPGVVELCDPLVCRTTGLLLVGLPALRQGFIPRRSHSRKCLPSSRDQSSILSLGVAGHQVRPAGCRGASEQATPRPEWTAWQS